MVLSLSHALPQKTIQFTFWKQKVSQRAVRTEQSPCDQSVHGWNRQAAKICSSGLDLNPPTISARVGVEANVSLAPCAWRFVPFSMKNTHICERLTRGVSLFPPVCCFLDVFRSRFGFATLPNLYQTI